MALKFEEKECRGLKNCPSCRQPVDDNEASCPFCSVIFSKWQDRNLKTAAIPSESFTPPFSSDTTSKTTNFDKDRLKAISYLADLGLFLALVFKFHTSWILALIISQLVGWTIRASFPKVIKTTILAVLLAGTWYFIAGRHPGTSILPSFSSKASFTGQWERKDSIFEKDDPSVPFTVVTDGQRFRIETISTFIKNDPMKRKLINVYDGTAFYRCQPKYPKNEKGAVVISDMLNWDGTYETTSQPLPKPEQWHSWADLPFWWPEGLNQFEKVGPGEQIAGRETVKYKAWNTVIWLDKEEGVLLKKSVFDGENESIRLLCKQIAFGPVDETAFLKPQ